MKKFIIKKMLQSKMKGIPEEQLDQILDIVEKNPELFQKMATEIQEAISGGKSEMEASMEVMQKYQGELKNLS